ncbi:hypothetical protein METP2_00797 [Methanosarcinales archaeon]|nr:hypothetical protein [Candidatus Methanoperedens sp.]CAG0961142.1 hypothetical protein METP2_00797 [Methanosarcinales archaeon]
MNKNLVLLLCILITLSIYSAANIEKHPNDAYIIKNYNKYEEKQIFLRATVLDVQKNYEEFTIDANTAGMAYRIYVKDILLDYVPKKGDFVDIRAISHLDKGYVVALEAHVRTGLEHKLLFLRSLAAIPVVLFLLWREHHQLAGGS